jgi:hypothetical protein
MWEVSMVRLPQYDNKIQNSKNKNKAIWDIEKQETNKVPTTEKISTLNVEGKLIRRKQMIAETFNIYFYQSLKIEM